MAEPTKRELYSVDFNELCNLIGVERKTLTVELHGHMPMEDPIINFPDQFTVEIIVDPSNDTDTLRCYVQNDEPFWHMGYSDTGYWATLAMFRLYGKNKK